MRVAVTGATGFIGNHFVAELVAGGFEPVPICRSPAPGMANVQMVGDLAAQGPLPLVNWSSDAMVHLAALASPPRGNPSDVEAAYQAANVDGTARALRIAAASGANCFLFMSSIKAMGESSNPSGWSETDRPCPEDAYGRSKLAAEQIVRELAPALGMDWIIVRPPAVYGPGGGTNLALLQRLARSGLPIPLASIRNLRSIVSCKRLVTVAAGLLTDPRARNEIYHVADPVPLSTPQLIDRLAAEGDPRPWLVPCPPALLKAAASLLGKRHFFDKIAGSLVVDTRKLEMLIASREAPIPSEMRA